MGCVDVPGTQPDGRLERGVDVGRRERNGPHAIAVVEDVAADLRLGVEAGGDEDPDRALLEHIADPVANTGLRSRVGHALEAEPGLKEVRNGPRVTDPELEVIPARERLGWRAR